MSIAASILIGVTVIAVFCVLVVMLMDIHDLMADLREMDESADACVESPADQGGDR